MDKKKGETCTLPSLQIESLRNLKLFCLLIPDDDEKSHFKAIFSTFHEHIQFVSLGSDFD